MRPSRYSLGSDAQMTFDSRQDRSSHGRSRQSGVWQSCSGMGDRPNRKRMEARVFLSASFECVGWRAQSNEAARASARTLRRRRVAGPRGRTPSW